MSIPTEGFSSSSDTSSLDGGAHLKDTLVSIGTQSVGFIAFHVIIRFTIEISFASIVLLEIGTFSQKIMEHLVVTVQISYID